MNVRARILVLAFGLVAGACADVARVDDVVPTPAVSAGRVPTSTPSPAPPADVHARAHLGPPIAHEVRRVAQVTHVAPNAETDGVRVPRALPAQTWSPPVVQVGARTLHPVTFDGHVHSSHSRDAQHPPRAVLAYAARADLDAVVLTDHGTTLGVTELVADDRGAPVPVLAGAEVGGTFGHAVVWGFDDYTRLHDAPHQELADVAAVVRPQGALLVLAHPGWWIRGNLLNPRFFMQPDSLRPGGRAASVEALELWNGTYPVMSRRLVDEWATLLARGLFVPVVGGSDFHELGGQILGEPRNVALCPEAQRTGEAIFTCILEATRAGRLYVTDGPTIALTLGDATLGETVVSEPGASLALRVRAAAPGGGRLVVYLGEATHARRVLAPGEIHEETITLPVGDTDTFVRVEIERPARVPLHAPFSLLTNPIFIDVPPGRASHRGAPLDGPQSGWPGRGMVRRRR